MPLSAIQRIKSHCRLKEKTRMSKRADDKEAAKLRPTETTLTGPKALTFESFFECAKPDATLSQVAESRCISPQLKRHP
jgi:hypothetical protein